MPLINYKGIIYVSNNGIIIYPYKKGQCKKIERITSVYDHVYHRSEEVTGFRINYKDSEAFVTYGLNPNFVQGLLPEYKVEFIPEITPRYSLDYSLNSDIQLRDAQSNIATILLANKTKHEWFINLPTAQGKTLLSVYIASVFNYKTMILTYSTNILTQWIQTFTEKTNIDPNRIYLVKDSATLENIYNNEFDYDNYDIYLCTTSLITQFIHRNSPDKLDIIFRKIGIGFRIYDEAHLHKGAIIRINAFVNVRHTLYLSADYAQSNKDLEQMYFDIFSKTMIIKPSSEEIASMKYTQAVIVEFNSNPDEIERKSIYNRYGYSAQKYLDYELNKGILYKTLDIIMASIIEILENINKGYDYYRTLILAPNIDHVEKLYEYFYSKYSDKFSIGKFYGNSGTVEEKEFVKHHSDIVIATYKSFGTGIDTTKIKYIIGLNQSNKIEDNQAAGRGRPLPDNTDIFYFIVLDNGFSYCKKKLKSRLEYLKLQKIKGISRFKVYL